MVAILVALEVGTSKRGWNCGNSVESFVGRGSA